MRTKSTLMHCWIRLDSVPSTNDWAKEHAAEFDPYVFTCIIAQHQSAGRGTKGKIWASPAGNLYLTIFFSLPPMFPYVHNIGQLLALSACETVRKAGIPCFLKWPNDLVIDTKKVGGILCETIALKNRIGVIAGIGLNIYMPGSLLTAISQPATSLFQTLPKIWDIDELAQSIGFRFFHASTMLACQGFRPFAKPYSTYMAFRGGTVLYTHAQTTYLATCGGVNDTGALCLQTDEGNVVPVYSGSIQPVAKVLSITRGWPKH